MKNARVSPRWVDFMQPGNPHGLRFVEGEQGQVGTVQAGEKKPDESGGDEPLGDNGKKALQSERDARKALEKQVQDLMEGQKSQMQAIAQAFGVKVGKDDDGEALVATLQKQLADMQHETAVERAARKHGITDDGDLALLATARGDALEQMAARLAPADNPTGTPKPDKTQGGKADETKPSAQPGTPRLAQAFEDIFATQ